MTTATGTTARSLTYVLPRQPSLVELVAFHSRGGGGFLRATRLAATEPMGEFYRRVSTARASRT